MRGAIEPRASLLSARRLAIGIGVVLGNFGLILAQNIDSETLARGKVGVGLRIVVDAHQN